MTARFLASWLGLALSVACAQTAAQPRLGTRGAPLLTVDGLSFRDLNRNGKLDVYEDWRRPAAERARDLVSQMTLEEKAGALMHGTAPGKGGMNGFGAREYDQDLARRLILERKVTSMISRLSIPPAQLAAANNALQAIAEEGRLGIPLTLSTDPRHHFQYTAGASVEVRGLSQWPETLGFGALNDPAVTRRFGDIARQEYRALGFQMALSPQADLATEPRWPRVNGTFGEDPELVNRQTRAYVEGFQNGAAGVGRDSVATIVKHWAAYGAAKDGWDSHSYYGRYGQVSEDAFALHVRPFLGAFQAKTAGVMPTYSIFENLTVKGKAIEQVGGGYNAWLLQDKLRGEQGYQGMIVSDWAITNDCGELCRNGFPAGTRPTVAGISTAWGMEDAPVMDRFAKGVNAGLDQFGGTEDSASLVAAVRAEKVSIQRLEQSVVRDLEVKFALGLFENPFVDETQAASVAGKPEWVQLGRETQARSMVLLRNEKQVLPLAAGKRVYLRGVAKEAAQAAGYTVVDTPEQADAAIVRAAAPYQTLHPNFFFGARHHEGDLDFKEDSAELKLLRELGAKLPVVLAIYLDRPAILTNVIGHTAAILANFGATDAALFDALSGKVKPEGKLPFELPRSMESVRKQRPDLPHDSGDPLFPIFAGLRYR